MDQNGIKISNYIVQIVAEKLKSFIKDKEVTFKFHPWQMTSTLSKIRKILNTGLHERSLHHLLDTGAARELLNFSNKKRGSEKVQQVAEYLYAYLGLHVCQLNSNSKDTYNSKQLEKRSKSYIPGYNFPEKSLEDSRVFEIKKLVEAVAQELAYLLAVDDDHNHSTQYSWKISKFHLGVIKKQKLACCTSPDCLINAKKKLCDKRLKAGRKGKKRASPAKNFIIQNIQRYRTPGYSPRANIPPKVTEQKIFIADKTIQPKQVRPKITVETATQTLSWKRNIPSISNSYQETPNVMSEEEETETSDSEDDFYCKSDTLNDASMITEEIASDYLVAKPASSHTKSETYRSKEIELTQNGSSGRSEKTDSPNGKHSASRSLSQSEMRSTLDTKQSSGKQKVATVRRQSRVASQLSVETRVTNSLKVSSHSKHSRTAKTSMSLNGGCAVKHDTNDGPFPKDNSMSTVGLEVENPTEGSMENHVSDKKSNVDLSGSERQKDDSNKLPQDENGNAEKTAPEDVLEDAISEAKDGTGIEEVNETENLTEENGETEDKGESSMDLLQEVPRHISSSDNETTYLPVVSVSSASGSVEEENSDASSSAKENDDVSPEFSSHWTEEYSSTEVSESELVDESFRERFIAYKSSLLDEDDGVAASSEDETFNDSSKENSETAIVSNGTTATHDNELLETVDVGDIDKFRELLKSDENILMYSDEKGRNLLHLAAIKGKDNFVEELLNSGVPIESTTEEGYTALHLAIFNNHLKCCQVLLENGASLAITDEKDLIEKVDIAASSPVKRFLTKYQENLGKVRKLSEVLNHFGKKSKSSSTLSKNLLRTLTDLSLEDDEEPSDTSAL